MLRKSAVVVLLALVAGCVSAGAQKVELAGLGGGQFPQGNSTATFGRSGTAQINFAYRIAHVPLVSAYFEVPVVFGLESDVSPLGVFLNPPAIPRNYTSLFVTPGLRVKFAPGFPISPYLAAGVGVARLTGSTTLINGATNTDRTSTSAMFDIGGGLDWKIAPFLSLRGEVRDFYTGLPNGESLSGRQHSVVPAGGLVLRF